MKELIYIAAQSYTQQQIILFLREYFAKQPDTFYKWEQNPAKTKIFIGAEYAQQRVDTPSVIVGDVSGNLYNRMLGQEMITNIYENVTTDGVTTKELVGYRLAGIYSLDVTIDVYSYQLGERRRIVELVGSAIRHLGLGELQTRNIAVNKIDVSRPQIRVIGNELLQTVSTTLGVITQWYKDVKELDKLETILIEEINVVNTTN
jgi:hypothetical protein